MDIELDPPNGITGFPLGMPAQDVKTAAAGLGAVEVSDEGSADPIDHMRVFAEHPQVSVHFLLEDGKTLTAVELWAPEEGPEPVEVRFRDIDVFGTRALEVVERLRAVGLSVVHDGEGYWAVPGLSLGFTRPPADDVPLDVDGEPLYFQSVLVGPADYYDSLLDDESVGDA